MSGAILLLDKASGLTSAKALNQLKRKLKLKKIGHSGTLDPMASGLLVCLLDGATRLASFAEQGQKTYSGVIQFGIRTDTDDITGATLEQCLEIPDFKSIENAVLNFVGEIEQVPPNYSAVKVDGVRAYELARQGQSTELKARKVTVERFQIEALSQNSVFFRVVCSKGTYIRSLARDLGQMLGCGACLASLRREASAPFHVLQAKRLEDIELKHALSVKSLFPNLLSLEVEPALAKRLVCGDERALREVESDLERGSYAGRAAYQSRGSDEPLGILVKEGSQWKFAVNLSS